MLLTQKPFETTRVPSTTEMSTTDSYFEDEVETSEDEILNAPTPLKLSPVLFLLCQRPTKICFEDEVETSEDEMLNEPKPTKLHSVPVFLYKHSTK